MALLIVLNIPETLLLTFDNSGIVSRNCTQTSVQSISVDIIFKVVFMERRFYIHFLVQIISCVCARRVVCVMHVCVCVCVYALAVSLLTIF
jgi:hypothetical protein